MADPSYYVMGASIHSFLMFAPFFVLYEKKGMILQGLFLFIFGPGLASMISDNLQEQASIWCFFSIAQVRLWLPAAWWPTVQISIMLFLIRETLIIHWGKNISVFDKKSTAANTTNQLELIECRDFKDCEYCKAENAIRMKLMGKKDAKADIARESKKSN